MAPRANVCHTRKKYNLLFTTVCVGNCCQYLFYLRYLTVCSLLSFALLWNAYISAVNGIRSGWSQCGEMAPLLPISPTTLGWDCGNKVDLFAYDSGIAALSYPNMNIPTVRRRVRCPSDVYLCSAPGELHTCAHKNEIQINRDKTNKARSLYRNDWLFCIWLLSQTQRPNCLPLYECVALWEVNFRVFVNHSHVLGVTALVSDCRLKVFIWPMDWWKQRAKPQGE